MAAPTHIETVLVENSDDRLAAVEEAKRTGQPFQSVAANKAEVVPYDVAFQIANDKSLDNTYVGRFGATYAAHLEPWHEAIGNDPQVIADTNEEKARAHHEYSADLVRRQMEDEARVQKLMAEGYEPSVAVQQANLERAREHEAKSTEYTNVRREFNKDRKPVLQMVDEAVEILRAEDLALASTADRAAALRTVANVPDASEAPATEAIVTKDQISSVERPYKDEVADHEELQKRDRPAISLMDAAGSPEELMDETKVAQLYADNFMFGKAQEAARELDEAARNISSDDTANEPAKVQREAEESVNPRTEADEMRDNPTP